MRSTLALTLALAVCAGSPAAAQSMPPVPANAVLPRVIPAVPLASWAAAPGRATIVLDTDGATLRGYDYAGTDATLPAVVVFNGNAETVDGSDRFYRSLAALGPRVVAFDYRGYGFSSGTPDVAAFQRDGVAIAASLAKTRGVRVVPYGFSLGSAVAAYTAAHVPVAGLILAAPIATAREELPVFARGMGAPDSMAQMLVPAPDAEAAFDEVGFVNQSTAPLLVLHGTADAAVPIAQGREVLAASAASRKRIVELPGVDHNGTPDAQASRDAVRAFVASLRP